MTLLKYFGIFLISSILCAAQTVTYKGTVKDNSDQPISGATIKVENRGISALTNQDGKFSLTIEPTKIRLNGKNNASLNAFVLFKNRQFELSLLENNLVKLQILNLNGERILNLERTLNKGIHLFTLPTANNEIFIYNIIIGQSSFTFKSVMVEPFSNSNSVQIEKSVNPLGKMVHTQSTSTINLSVVKENFLTNRFSIKLADTNGLLINMIPSAGSVVDVDGITYQTVKLGNQVWLAENLRTTKYKDLTPIPLKTDKSQWSDSKDGAQCNYGNNNSNEVYYGKLYNWFAVNSGKLAPKGWHVPTDVEWDTLKNYLISNKYNWNGTVTGNKVAKSMAAKTDWKYDFNFGSIGNDLSKNNSSGFSALPAGTRNFVGNFEDIGGYGLWWTATGYDATRAYRRELSFEYPDLQRTEGTSKNDGLSVRLVKD